MATTCLQTLDPGGAYRHRVLTMPAEVVLDAWLCRYPEGQYLPRQVLEDGSTDTLLANMAVIVFRMCHRNTDTDLFELACPVHSVAVHHSPFNDDVFVYVKLWGPNDKR